MDVTANSAETATGHTMRIEGFSPDIDRAPFLSRLAAMCLDYLVLLIVPVSWLLISGWFDDHGQPSLGGWVWFFGILVLSIDLVLLPLFSGQTIGKMIAGIRIVRIDGTDIGLAEILRRNVFGYLLTLGSLGLGFLLAGLMPTGRALHDLVGGTVVVRGRKILL